MYLSSNSVFQSKKLGQPMPPPSSTLPPPPTQKEFLQRLSVALKEQMPGESSEFHTFMAMMICACRDARKEARLTTTGSDDPEVNSSSLKLPPAVDSTGKLAPLKTREVWIEYGAAEPMNEKSDPQLSLFRGMSCTMLTQLWNDARSMKSGDGGVLLDMELVSVGPTVFVKCVAASRPEEPLSRYYSDYKGHKELDALSMDSAGRQSDVTEIFSAAKRMVQMLMEKKSRTKAGTQPSVEELACIRLIILLTTLVCKTTLEFSCILSPGYEDITLRVEGMPSVSVPMLMYIQSKHPSVLTQFNVAMREKHLLLDDVAPSVNGQQQRGGEVDEYSVRPISSHHLVVDFFLNIEGAKAGDPGSSSSTPAPLPPTPTAAPIAPEEPPRMTGKKRGREDEDDDAEPEFSHKRIKLEL